MEASIIFHFAGRGVPGQRLALVDFAQLLDPRWKAPYSHYTEYEDQQPIAPVTAPSLLHRLGASTYSFVQGGANIFDRVLSNQGALILFIRYRRCLRRNHRLSYRHGYVFQAS